MPKDYGEIVRYLRGSCVNLGRQMSMRAINFRDPDYGLCWAGFGDLVQRAGHQDAAEITTRRPTLCTLSVGS